MKCKSMGLSVVAIMLLVLPAAAVPLRYMLREGQNPMQQQAGSEELEESGSTSAVVSVPAGTKIRRDIAYGPDPAQRFDVYLPPNVHQGAPTIFMVHGGGWQVGDKAHSSVVNNKVSRWLPEGFIFVSTNYRMWPKADPLTQANDVARALAVAQSMSGSWGGSPSRFVLMGHSAGGHLAVLAAVDPYIASKQGVVPLLGTISLDTACFDVARRMGEQHSPAVYRPFGNDPSYWRNVSPIYCISGIPAPMLLVCSSYRNDSCSEARNFAAKVNSVGGHATVLPIPLRHREINQNLGLAGSYTDAVESFMRSLGLP